MPIAPVWWLDDAQAASMSDQDLEKLLDATNKYNKKDLKELKKLKGEIDPLLSEQEG